MESWEAVQRVEELFQGYSEAQLLIIFFFEHEGNYHSKLTWLAIMGNDQVVYVCVSVWKCLQFFSELLGKYLFFLFVFSKTLYETERQR